MDQTISDNITSLSREQLLIEQEVIKQSKSEQEVAEQSLSGREVKEQSLSVWEGNELPVSESVVFLTEPVSQNKRSEQSFSGDQDANDCLHNCVKVNALYHCDSTDAPGCSELQEQQRQDAELGSCFE